MTSSSESGILETILSRVQSIHTGLDTPSQRDNFFYSLIDNYIQKKDMGIFGYFFQTKLESEDAVVFLNTLIEYAKTSPQLLSVISHIDDDIHLIQKNNANSKYIVDSYLIALQEV
jgi:hypothetical protein